MKISLITITYNSDKTLIDTINSVRNQTYNNIEYIIVDGGSKDETLKIIENNKDIITHFISEPDKGIYDAMNKGVNLATGDIVGILNSDDFYANKDVISKVVNQFNDNVDGVYADLNYVDPIDTTKTIRVWKSGNYIEGSFKKGWMPPHPTFFVKKEVYNNFGGYSIKLKSAADYEFMLRVIHKEKIRISYLPETIVMMRAGGLSNASLKNRIKANREDREAWRMNNIKPGLFTLIQKPLSKALQFLKK
ncbi:glycosyltransferase family 2 protein [Crocinitomix catalasitica]|uniref:glycosyltransferase family 2 protein n=1 Tax=Crocinitomix catalasitica TaxID=184607 RepID=UPI00047F65E7|nr:glycosyltransferase family 2 protein [Crocinitomix catalasitica]